MQRTQLILSRVGGCPRRPKERCPALPPWRERSGRLDTPPTPPRPPPPTVDNGIPHPGKYQPMASVPHSLARGSRPSPWVPGACSRLVPPSHLDPRGRGHQYPQLSPSYTHTHTHTHIHTHTHRISLHGRQMNDLDMCHGASIITPPPRRCASPSRRW